VLVRVWATVDPFAASGSSALYGRLQDEVFERPWAQGHVVRGGLQEGAVSDDCPEEPGTTQL
jgi:hypothetical protein